MKKRDLLRFAALLCAALFLLTSCKKREEEEPAPSAEDKLKIGYASQGVTVIDDVDELQKAVDEAYEQSRQPGIGLQYINDAYSEDGVNFDCSIGNPDNNEYDMFIAIYRDIEMNDLLYLSQLLRPGEKFEHITLDKPLDKGDHQVIVGFTQVVEEDGEQKIHAQIAITMNFHVS